MWISVVLSLFCITLVISVHLPGDACLEPLPPNFDIDECCHLQEVLENPTIITECVNKYLKGTESKPKDARDVDFICYAHCVLKQTGAITDNKLNLEMIHNVYNEKLKEEKEWKPIVLDALTDCETSISKLFNLDAYYNNTGCSQFPQFYFGCINTHLFRNCPAAYWHSNPICEKLKTNAESCPLLLALIDK